MFGSDNMWIAENHDLSDGWTASMANRQVLCFEELGIFDKRETYEAIKRWITEDWVMVNEKFVTKHLARTPRLMLAFSNHQAPTALQEGDRRWWVSRSPAEPKESGYYNRLFNEGLQQVSAFLHSLLNRDISPFNPSAPPPITTAKSEIMSWSRPVVEQEIEIMMEQVTYPFHRDLVVAETVREEVANRHRGKWPTLREVTTALKLLGAIQLQQVRLDQSARIRPWAWRNIETWRQAATEEIKKDFLELRAS
jgi:hypothetical protein